MRVLNGLNCFGIVVRKAQAHETAEVVASRCGRQGDDHQKPGDQDVLEGPAQAPCQELIRSRTRFNHRWSPADRRSETAPT